MKFRRLYTGKPFVIHQHPEPPIILTAKEKARRQRIFKRHMKELNAALEDIEAGRPISGDDWLVRDKIRTKPYTGLIHTLYRHPPTPWYRIDHPTIRSLYRGLAKSLYQAMTHDPRNRIGLDWLDELDEPDPPRKWPVVPMTAAEIGGLVEKMRVLRHIERGFRDSLDGRILGSDAWDAL